jgi:hypothetical protein
VSFALGTWTRKPIPVFFFPRALLLVCVFFLWSWEPSWLLSDHPRIDRLIGWLDPTGFRWLNHTWLQVDRGVGFYNTRLARRGRGLRAQSLALGRVGLLAVQFAERSFAASLRGTRAAKRRGAPARVTSSVHAPSAAPLARARDALAPPSSRARRARGRARRVARAEEPARPLSCSFRSSCCRRSAPR